MTSHPRVGSTTASKRPLLCLVFLAGIGSMTVEMCASRLLAPYFGSSTIVWANIIGLVLASLSLGYWLGGRIADRRPSHRLLGWLVLSSALAVAAIPFAARPFLDLSVQALDQVHSGAIIGSLAASALLFVPPVLLLGTVTPFAIRLAVENVADAGSVAGRVFALSTAGSLLGTFLPALVTIPLVGTRRTLLGAAVLLGLAASLLLGRRWTAVGVLLATILALPAGTVKARAGLLAERESRYQFIQIVQSGETRSLYLNEGRAIHSQWRADAVLTGGEWDMFLTLPALIGYTPTRVTMLGNAGGTTARAYGTYFPATRIDGVELDGEVSAMARGYLGLADNPRLRVITADARPFLRSAKTRYDLVMIDAYRQPYVPFYLTTREFFREVRDRLTEDGAVALNVTTLPGDTRLADAVASTLAREFPLVVTWQALRFNQLVVGLRNPAELTTLRRRLRSASGDLAPLTRLFATNLRQVHAGRTAWSDDHAPVEWITDRMIVGYAVRGADAHESLLPTAP